MSGDVCKRPSCPHLRNSKCVGAPEIAPKTQLGQHFVPTSNVALSSPGFTCTAPFAVGVPVEAGLVTSTTLADAVAVAKTHVGLLTSPNMHSIVPGAEVQDNLADTTSCTAGPGGVLCGSPGRSQRESGEEVSCQGTAMPSLRSTTPILTYSSAVTDVPEMCYRGKSADSKLFAPEIRRSAAQIRSKFTINDKRRGTPSLMSITPPLTPSSAVTGVPEMCYLRKSTDSKWRVTHRITLTPIPGTAPAAGRSPHQTVRSRGAPPHTPHADIQNSHSGSL